MDLGYKRHISNNAKKITEGSCGGEGLILAVSGGQHIGFARDRVGVLCFHSGPFYRVQKEG